MADFMLWDKIVSPEQYVKYYLCRNLGSKTPIQKPLLQSLLTDAGGHYGEKDTKAQLVDKLFEVLGSWDAVARAARVSVRVQDYLRAFPELTAVDVRRFTKHEALTVVDHIEFRLYGKIRTAPLYDAIEYYHMTDQGLRKLMDTYPPRGYKKPSGN